ncbi:MAG TPA: AraC family transcriptional regulator [Verrucomicrobiae bacterium]|nr:AraC family transcriptional regulator [Verrucomicrobiae bacterium]
MKSDLLARAAASSSAPTPFAAELAIIEQLFDHVPETAFFLKDTRGRYQAVNQSLVQRCGLEETRQLIGRDVREIFPKDLAQLYAMQDQTVLRTGCPVIDHLELHWYAHRQQGWCLTTKLPMRDRHGTIVGVVGISRDLRAPGDREIIPASLASTLEYLEAHCDEAISPAALARLSGLPPVRFARLIKRIFRVTPNQLITQTRLAAAARLLTETNRSVADIAYACGFYDHSAMTRAFRSATNQTPTEFRAVMRKPS